MIYLGDGDNGEVENPDPSLADENEEGGGEVEIETPTEAGENNN